MRLWAGLPDTSNIQVFEEVKFDLLMIEPVDASSLLSTQVCP